MNIEKSLLEEIEQKTNISFESILVEVSTFIENDYENLVDYFSGTKSSITSLVFERFDKIYLDFSKKIDELSKFRTQLVNTKFVGLFEELQNLKDKLDTIKNLHRWLRSSVSDFSYQRSFGIEYVTQFGDTVERISRSVLKRRNFLDNWLDFALSNSLTEDSMDSLGGKKVTLPTNTNIVSFPLTSVVDVIEGRSCYGKDIKRELLFEDDDLKVLDFSKTVEQSVETLITLKKGDNLDNPELGLQEEIFVGSNRSFFNTPVLVRQLASNFQSDDSLVNFQVIEIKVEQDNFLVDFRVETILGENLNKTVTI